MRHLEHAAEDKFWEAWIKDDTTLFYRFGKSGSQGQTRVKRFGTRAEAEADLEENVGRKLAEGFSQKGSAAPASPKVAPAAQPAPTPRKASIKRAVKPELATGARNALEALQHGLGGRSWKVRHLGRRARHALERIRGADPAKAGFGDAFDALMAQVVATEKRLPLDIAVELLAELDVGVFARTVKRWKGHAQGSAKEAVAVLVTSCDAVDDEDVLLHVGAAFAERQLDAASWRKRFHRIKPELEEALKKNGSTLARYLKSLDGGDDTVLVGRIEEAAR
jgi:predicted DNA-binding WGR domain protein